MSSQNLFTVGMRVVRPTDTDDDTSEDYLPREYRSCGAGLYHGETIADPPEVGRIYIVTDVLEDTVKLDSGNWVSVRRLIPA